MFPVGIGLRDPRSQKRDLGAPFDFTLECCRVQALSFLSRLALSESAAQDEKGEIGVSMRIGAGGRGPVGAGHTNGAPQVPRLRSG